MLKKKEYAPVGETAFTAETRSGLRVTVVPKPGFRKSMAFLAVNYGGADREFTFSGERFSTPAGTAHFVEHRLFEVEGQANALTTLSQRGANANAFTSPDMTAYHFECTDSFFENLRLLLQFVSTPYFTGRAWPGRRRASRPSPPRRSAPPTGPFTPPGTWPWWWWATRIPGGCWRRRRS